jgi:hypothetical protein
MSIASRNSHTGHIATKLCIVRAFEWPVRSLITTQVHRINTCMETPAAHSTGPLRRQHNTFAPSCIDCRSPCGACTPRWCAAARPTTHYVVRQRSPQCQPPSWDASLYEGKEKLTQALVSRSRRRSPGFTFRLLLFDVLRLDASISIC